MPEAAARKKKTDRLSRRQRYLQRKSTLWSERSSWDAHWREIASLMLPRAFRGNLSDVNRGTKKNEKILNATAQIAIRTLAAGMMAGIVSPSRPWMRLTLAVEELVESVAGVKEWLHECTTLLLAQFARTNFYRATAGSALRHLAAFGTHASVVLRDRKTVLRFYPLMMGSYALASSSNGEIDTLYREVPFTVGQLVEEFGLEACSLQVQRLWEADKLDARVAVLHVIEPHRDYDPSKADARGKRWSSVWMESSNEGDKNLGFLRESGHHNFPALAPRWGVEGEDTYGCGPGMDALPSARQANKLEYNLALLVALITGAPTSAPAALADTGGVNLSPKGVTYRPSSGNPAADKIDPIFDQQALAHSIDRAEAAIERRDRRIREAFFVDFWLAMLNDDRATPATAEEVRAKKEERMLQLGPVLESMQAEYLAPAIELIFDAMMEERRLPPPPPALIEELQRRGHSTVVFDVEYVSIAAAAQRALGLTSVRAFLEIVAQARGVDPSVLDNIDVDVLVQEAARVLGVNPKIVKGMNVVKQLRAARARQQQAAEAGQAALAAAKGARDLATSPAPGADNLLGPVLSAMGPQASQLLPAPANQVP